MECVPCASSVTSPDRFSFPLTYTHIHTDTKQRKKLLSSVYLRSNLVRERQKSVCCCCLLLCLYPLFFPSLRLCFLWQFSPPHKFFSPSFSLSPIFTCRHRRLSLSLSPGDGLKVQKPAGLVPDKSGHFLRREKKK